MTATGEKTVRKFARIYSIDDKPAYVIGVTNNTDDYARVFLTNDPRYDDTVRELGRRLEEEERN